MHSRFFCNIILLFVFSLSFELNAQDSTKTTKTIIIEAKRLLETQKNNQLQTVITKEAIDLIQPEDLGNILQKVPGITLKSYGGLGGLKTVSIRGIGAGHSRFVIDQFLLANAQTGQINVGQQAADNIEQVSIGSNVKKESMLPASAFLNGNLISIRNQNNVFGNKDEQLLNAKIGIGSFGQQDYFLSTKIQSKNIFVSTYLKRRVAIGNYSYEILNGLTIEESKRINNDLDEWYGGFSMGYQFKNQSVFRVITQFKKIKQGLPGAVILYNNSANQRLGTNQKILLSDFNCVYKKLKYRIFGSIIKDDLNYQDPSFLNQSGGINSTYFNTSFNGGLTANYSREKFNVNYGIEYLYNQLTFSEQSNIPKRNQEIVFFNGSYRFKKSILEMNNVVQFVQEENKYSEKINRYNYSPVFIWSSLKKGNRAFVYSALVRRSYRLPNFNEMYYNNIGNVNLKPETAYQTIINIEYNLLKSSDLIRLNSSVYYNKVDNQILALPTKNLFIWSIQNIGKVDVFGGDLKLSYSQLFYQKLKLVIDANYSFQKVIDVSDKNSPTYRNQVAYIPVHSFSSDLLLKYNNFGIRWSTYSNGVRYTLNENIAANQLNAFWINDFGIWYKLKKEKTPFKIHFSVKNSMNTSYEFVKYFVMPGRNYLITLNYEIR